MTYRIFLLLLVVGSVFSGQVRSASLPTVVGKFELKDEYVLVMNIVESTGDRSGIVTQTTQYKNLRNGSSFDFKIEYLNNTLAINYFFVRSAQPIEETRIGVWKYQFFAARSLSPSRHGIEAALHAPGYGKISIDVQTNDPDLEDSDLIKLVKNINIDLKKSIKIIQDAKVHAKTIRTSKEAVSTPIGSIPLTISAYASYRYVKQIYPSQTFELASGFRIGFGYSETIFINPLNFTVLESFCAKAKSTDFDLDDFYNKSRFVLFDGTAIFSGKKDFIGDDFAGTIEKGEARIDARQQYAVNRTYEANLIKIRKGSNIYIVRILSDSDSPVVLNALLSGLKKTNLACRPLDFFQPDGNP